MGIQGLLKSLQPVLKESRHSEAKKDKQKSNIRQFAHKTLAVDASSWLHKGGYACSERLVESIDKNTVDPICIKIYTNYILKRCDELLRYANIGRIILVFDGIRCPLKADTNKEREARRKENLREARRLKEKGRYKESSEKYKSCVKVTDTMARNVALAVRSKYSRSDQVCSVFAPYEADAQLAQLCHDGTAHAVVTEDSDIILYSLSCGSPFPICYKLDRDTGNCDIISMTWLLSQHSNSSSDSIQHGTTLCRKATGTLAGILRFIALQERRKTGTGRRLFVQACILAGCDYSSNLPGVGLVTAFKMIKEHAYKDADERFRHVLRTIKRNQDKSPTKIPFDFDFDSYEKTLVKSEAAFFYHVVWRIRDNSVGHLVSPITEQITSSDDERTNHRPPSTLPFNHDLSFLGSIDQRTFTEKNQNAPTQSVTTTSSSSSKPYACKPMLSWIQRKSKRNDVGSSNQTRPIRDNRASIETFGKTATVKRKVRPLVNNDSSRKISKINNDSLTNKSQLLSSSSSDDEFLDYNPFSKYTFNEKEPVNKAIVSSCQSPTVTSQSPTIRTVSIEAKNTHNSSKRRLNEEIELSEGYISDDILENSCCLGAHHKQDAKETSKESPRPFGRKSPIVKNSSAHLIETDLTAEFSIHAGNMENDEDLHTSHLPNAAFDLKTKLDGNGSNTDTFWDDYDDNDCAIIDDPKLAIPITDPNDGKKTVNNPYHTPFVSTSYHMERLKSCIPKGKKKKKVKNTIMSGFKKQQELYQHSFGKRKTKKVGADCDIKKKSGSIDWYFGPLSVRKG